MGISINHIALVSKDPQKTKAFFQLLGAIDAGSEDVVSENVRTTFLSAGQGSTPPSFEIVEALGDDDAHPIRKYANKFGSGIHHVAVNVQNIHQTIKTLQKSEIQLVHETPKEGAHGTLIAFVHPRSTGGILVELVQNK